MTFNNCNKYYDFLNINQNFTGVCTVLYPNGKKEYEYSLVNGKKHGKQFSWYKNGKKEYEYNYVNGFRIGIQLDGKETYEITPEENPIWHIFVREAL